VSAPPLPEVFGNYVLGEFVEVVSPGSVSWLPQTAGWAILGVVLAGGLLRFGWRRLRRWYGNRYRREAAARLAQFDTHEPGEYWLVEINKLLKLTALAAYPREQVAPLSGVEWVDFLNRQCPEAPFSPEQGELLATGTYKPTQLGDPARQRLLAASLTWVRTHGEPRRV
jgi:hypothetical protein